MSAKKHEAFKASRARNGKRKFVFRGRSRRGFEMARDKYLMIYCVNYGNTFDDEKFFLNQEDAARCAAADRVKYALIPEDQMLGVKPVKVWKQYNPKKHGHDEGGNVQPKESAKK